MQSGKYMYVSGGNPNSPNIYSTNYGSSTSNNASSFAGQVRYNVSNQYLEVFDGNIWHLWQSTYANVGLSPDAEQILDWAEKKMKEERELERVAKENIAIQELYNEIKEKQNQIKMIQTLIKNDETVT